MSLHGAGGSLRPLSPKSKMTWDVSGHPGMSGHGSSVRSLHLRSKYSWDVWPWRQCKVPESQVQDVRYISMYASGHDIIAVLNNMNNFTVKEY